MKLFSVLMALIGGGSAQKDFPSYDSGHHYCEVKGIESYSNCADTMAALAKVFNFYDTPESDKVVDFAVPPGEYIKYKPEAKETSSMVWGKRIQDYGVLVDDVAFYVAEEKGKFKCMLTAKSRGQH